MYFKCPIYFSQKCNQSRNRVTRIFCGESSFVTGDRYTFRRMLDNRKIDLLSIWVTRTKYRQLRYETAPCECILTGEFRWESLVFITMVCDHSRRSIVQCLTLLNTVHVYVKNKFRLEFPRHDSWAPHLSKSWLWSTPPTLKAWPHPRTQWCSSRMKLNKDWDWAVCRMQHLGQSHLSHRWLSRKFDG